MIYPRLNQQEMARALDIKGRNKAVAANLLPVGVLVALGCYWLINRAVQVDVVLLAVVAFTVALVVGVKLQSDAVIESVCRCKEGKNKAIYLKHKYYFDKQFKKYTNRPCIKQDSKQGRRG